MEPLRIRDIIDQAIRENRARERLLLSFAGMFILLGAVILIWGLAQNSLVAFAGVAESVLFVPAVALVRRISKENTALRMLEIPLRKAVTAEQAARVLTQFFAATHGFNAPWLSAKRSGS
jgi:hypothetical protein